MSTYDTVLFDGGEVQTKGLGSLLKTFRVGDAVVLQPRPWRSLDEQQHPIEVADFAVMACRSLGDGELEWLWVVVRGGCIESVSPTSPPGSMPTFDSYGRLLPSSAPCPEYEEAERSLGTDDSA
jgi:hypothetical protein